MKNIETIKTLLDQGVELESNVASIETVGGKTVFKLVEVPKEEPKPVEEPVKEPEPIPEVPTPEVPVIPPVKEEPKEEDEEPPTQPVEEPEVTPTKPVDVPQETLKEWGLKGDGTVDEQVILQKIFYSYAKSKKQLFMPDGEYLIDRELDLPSDLNLIANPGKVKFKLTGSKGKTRRVFRIEKGKSNISITGVSLDSNYKNHTEGDNLCFFVEENVKNLTMDYMSFNGGRQVGGFQVKAVPNALSSNFSFTNCKFNESGRSAMELRGLKGFRIENCEFTNYGVIDSDSPAIQLQSVPCYDFVIKSNIFKNTQGTQFAIEAASAWMYNGVIERNNMVDSVNKGGNGISGYFQNTVVHKNEMKGGVGHQRSGIEIFGSNHTITENLIERGSLVIGSGHLQNGDTVFKQQNIVAKKNRVSSFADNCPALVVAGATDKKGKVSLENVTITDNVFDSSNAGGGNTSAATLGFYGIQTIIKNITLENNQFKCNPKNRVLRFEAFAGSSDVIVMYNTLEGGDWAANYKTDNIENLVLTDNKLVNVKVTDDIYWTHKKADVKRKYTIKL